MKQFIFGPFRLDITTRQLWRGEQLVEIRPRPFAVLQHLVEHAGHVVSSEDILKEVWAGTYVSKASLKVGIRAIREALEDDAEEPQYIKTVGRVGYRFIAPLSTPPHSSPESRVQSPESEGQQAAPPIQTLDPRRQTLDVPLVGRETELTHLHHLFAKAAQGERQIAFVTGEAGIGKTALIETFVQGLASRVNTSPKSEVRSPKSDPAPSPQPLTLVVWLGWGQCIEHYGAEEAYRPVLEALGRLCHSPGGEHLLPILEQYAPTWLVQLPSLLTTPQLEEVQRRVQGTTRERMLREMAEALEALTATRTLVLVLEDVHWSDVSTIDLLNLLARRREPARLLVVATYRPTEVIVKHPLKQVKQELETRGLGVEVHLGRLEAESVQRYMSQRWAEAATDPATAAVVYRRTEGHPLFMVQLIEYLAQQSEPEALSTEVLDGVEHLIPQQLRQLLEMQLGQLTAEEQQVLEVGSVVGAEFTIASVAAGMGRREEEIEPVCEQLTQQGQFIAERTLETWPDGTVSGRYGFRHALYQEVLYQRLSASRRMRLHRQIGLREEHAYEGGGRTHEIAAKLAMHFERGRDYQRAAHYRQQAGENALRHSAHQEAINHLTRGLELLKSLADTPERSHRELELQMALGPVLIATAGYAAPAVANAYTRARELCQQGGEAPLLFRALFGLWAFHIVRAEHRTALTLAKQLLDLAESQPDSAFFVEAHWALGASSLAVGEMAVAQAHFVQSIARYDSAEHRPLAFLYGYDPGMSCRTVGAWALWALGYPEQALKQSQDAITLAQELSHPFSLAYALGHTARLHQFRREPLATQERTQAAITLSTEQGFLFFLTQGAIFLGVVSVEQGREPEGIEQIQRGITAFRATGAELYRPYFLGLLAEAYGKVAQAEEGLALLAEALAVVERTDERLYEAELYRLRGELMLAQSRVQSLESGVQENQKSKSKSQKLEEPRGWRLETGSSSQASSLQPLAPREAEQEVEGYFLKAIDIARQQQAKSLELRASTSLARLWQQRGKHHEAHNMLAEVYNWFTEGFETKDLHEAKTLIEELSH